MTLDSALQELVDKAGIRDVMMRYARGIDRRDMDLIASSFTPDAYANYGGRENQGRESIISRLRTGTSRFDHSTHFMGDQEIQINGDTADVETYAIDYLLYTVEGTQYQSMGGLRYVDKMVRQNGQWQVQHRVMHIDWRRNTLADTAVPGIDRVPISE